MADRSRRTVAGCAHSVKTEHIDVAYVANLARIELTAAERDLFQRQLDTILAYVRQLAEPDVEGIEPTSHGQAIPCALRPDEVVAGLDREVVLANAPARLDDEFLVPRIVE
jgi:aspartyl-tRNA(Asn)/glutamyl-tRNA(Gln) amidotransferase subunit C